MQIKEVRPGYVQIVVNRYSSEKKRTVTEVLPGGSFSILRGSVPPDLWAQLSEADQAKLMTFIGRRLGEIGAGRLTETAAGIPGQLAEIGKGWPAIIENVGIEQAETMVETIETAVKTFKRAAAKAARAAIKSAATEAETGN